MMATDKTLKILLVEDDQVDAKTFKRALKRSELEHEITHVENGSEALSFLEESNENPNLIFLDINMPIMNGLEFLEKVKTKDEYKSIPVIMLTTSQNENDKKQSFSNNAAGYFLKQLDFDNYTQVVSYITSYWTNSELIH